MSAMALGGGLSFAQALNAPDTAETFYEIIAPTAENGVNDAADLSVTDPDYSEIVNSDAEFITDGAGVTSDNVGVISDGGEMIFPSETNAFVKDYYVGATDQDAPFFETILPAIRENIEENNKHSITPYYDKMPLANNPENFQGLGSSTYENINGKTVTAEAFYRLKNESLHDPNAGFGLMVYQCIQYKLKHPEEDVKITFSSYRTSVTASVCVLPESKYYGYMRSLYGTNYDEHGFVRISYMLVEAARMGIEVTMINQLPSYGVSQYDPSTGKTKYRRHIDYWNYFSAADNTECYDKYAEGKKVSDFLNWVQVGWTVKDQTSNMQHVKSASVSHYLATDGTEHTSAVFFCSANLDENNYIGANGNNNSQSGVIVSDHDGLYRATYNFIQLMAEYSGKEQLQELRKKMADLNEKQISLLLSGRGDEIPADEQIVYVGGETDPVFELYFTPFGGGVDTWDTVNNPLCKHASKLLAGADDDYIEFVWNVYEYSTSYVGDTLSKLLEKAYCENPNPKNKISLKVTDFTVDAIKNLAVGKEIGYRSLKDGEGIHAKDYMMSYVEDGKRHYVSIITSCNFYMIAFNYRTNSMLVINENEGTGNGFYKAMGEKFSYGMISGD